MQKVQVTLIDDIDGSPAYITVPFMWEGVNYEIELSETNHKAMITGLAPFTEHARRTGRYPRARLAPDAKTVTAPARPGEQPQSPQRDNSGQAQAERALIRTWAREHGHAVAERGQIAKSVIAEYRAATETE